MADNNNFRIAMRGYNKEDVNRFILEGDKLRREAEADLQEKIQLISKERDDLRLAVASANEAKNEIDKVLEEKVNALILAEERIKELEKQLDEKASALAKQTEQSEEQIVNLEKRIAQANENITQAENTLKAQKSENASLASSLEETKKELAAAKEKIDELENAAPAALTETDGEIDEDLLVDLEVLKAELIKAQMENKALQEQLATTTPTTVTDDALQSRLGEVILQANRTAEQIIREANNTAKLIKMGAVEEATVIKKNFEDKMQQRAERAERLLNELSAQYFAQFESTKAELASKVSELITEKQTEFAEKTAAMQKDTEEGLLLTDAQAAALLNG